MATVHYEVFQILTLFWLHFRSTEGQLQHMTCNNVDSRRGRQMTVPGPECDLSTRSWCTVRTANYPEDLIMDILLDNRGIMKRLFGDQRQAKHLQFEHLNSVRDIPEPSPDIWRPRKRKPKVTKGTRGTKKGPLQWENVNTVGANVWGRTDTGQKTPSSNRSENSSATDEEEVNQWNGPAASFGHGPTEAPASIQPLEHFDDFLYVTSASHHSSLEDETYSSVSNNTTSPSSFSGPLSTPSAKEPNKLEADQQVELSGRNRIHLGNLEQATHLRVSQGYSGTPENNAIRYNEGLSSSSPSTAQVSPSAPPSPNPVSFSACNSTIEFIAPTWARNMQGKDLIVVNVGSFIQHFQVEECGKEDLYKRMYCRRGCRCEQKYRLHKLLVFDPDDECRGIFSEWFEFPSCCVCVCYTSVMGRTSDSRQPRMEMEDFYYDDYDYDEEDEDFSDYDSLADDPRAQWSTASDQEWNWAQESQIIESRVPVNQKIVQGSDDLRNGRLFSTDEGTAKGKVFKLVEDINKRVLPPPSHDNNVVGLKNSGHYNQISRDTDVFSSPGQAATTASLFKWSRPLRYNMTASIRPQRAPRKSPPPRSHIPPRSPSVPAPWVKPPLVLMSHMFLTYYALSLYKQTNQAQDDVTNGDRVTAPLFHSGQPWYSSNFSTSSPKELSGAKLVRFPRSRGANIDDTQEDEQSLEGQ